MIRGLQTHFNAPLDAETLAQVYAFGFRMARMDVQDCDSQTANGMIADTQAAGLRPLVVVKTVDQLRSLPREVDVEWQNEPDLALGRPEPIPPVVYSAGLTEAAAAAVEMGSTLWAPVVSNLNARGFQYLEDIGPLPDNIKVSFHRYGDGTVVNPHKGFSSREAEVQRLRDLIGPREWGVSETGFHTAPERKFWGLVKTRTTEAQQAALIRQEFELWERMGAAFCCLFQINDGPSDTREHRYGIRRFDGTWKPAAYVFQDQANV